MLFELEKSVEIKMCGKEIRIDMILIYLLCIKGDTELNEYMDSLAREPERLTTPHNTDTGETILHLLAKVFCFCILIS